MQTHTSIFGCAEGRVLRLRAHDKVSFNTSKFMFKSVWDSITEDGAYKYQ